MVESRSLRLAFATASVRDLIAEHVATALQHRGYKDVSASTLNFLGTLDCGVNFGSEIARRLNVSRQMVAKTVKELCGIGYLEQVEGPGRQKRILFTASGERLMSDVRKILARLDETLCARVGENALMETISTLEAIDEEVASKRDGPRA